MPPGGMGLERCLQSSLVTFAEHFFEELEFEEEDDEEMIGSESYCHMPKNDKLN